MPAKKQTKKVATSKLKTKGKFNWKIVTIIVVILAALGTILIRLTFASAPITCYYNTCGTMHDIGHLDNMVWPADWRYDGKTPTGSSLGGGLWSTNFPGGQSSAPSGSVARACMQMKVYSIYPKLKLFRFTAGIGNSYPYFTSMRAYDLSLNDIRWTMNSNKNGNHIEASGSTWVQGVYCADIGGSGNTKWGFSQIDAGVLPGLTDNANQYVIINYAQMQSL